MAINVKSEKIKGMIPGTAEDVLGRQYPWVAVLRDITEAGEKTEQQKEKEVKA